MESLDLRLELLDDEGHVIPRFGGLDLAAAELPVQVDDGFEVLALNANAPSGNIGPELVVVEPSPTSLTPFVVGIDDSAGTIDLVDAELRHARGRGVVDSDHRDRQLRFDEPRRNTVEEVVGLDVEALFVLAEVEAVDVFAAVLREVVIAGFLGAEVVDHLLDEGGTLRWSFGVDRITGGGGVEVEANFHHHPVLFAFPMGCSPLNLQWRASHLLHS